VIIFILGNTINATKLSSVAMREASSDIVEVRLVSGHDRLEVLHNQKALSFAEQSWMDLHGENHLDSLNFLFGAFTCTGELFLKERICGFFQHYGNVKLPELISADNNIILR